MFGSQFDHGAIRRESEIRHDLLAIEQQVEVGQFATLDLPRAGSLLRVDRITLDPNWSQDVLLTLRMGNTSDSNTPRFREMVRIPSVRFQVPGGYVLQGPGWTSEVGETRELTFINVGMRDIIVRGCIDYTSIAAPVRDRRF